MPERETSWISGTERQRPSSKSVAEVLEENLTDRDHF